MRAPSCGFGFIKPTVRAFFVNGSSAEALMFRTVESNQTRLQNPSRETDNLHGGEAGTGGMPTSGYWLCG
jgi:hypothetical protein